MKILVVDIETAPNLAWCWGLWNQNISYKAGQLEKSKAMMCWGALWHGSKRAPVMFDRGPNMVENLCELLDEAEVVVGFNSKKFDVKHIQWELAKRRMSRPSPFAQVDLYQVVKRQFAAPSSSLEYMCQELLGKGKAQTGGFQLWLDCMRDDPKAWAKMERYQKTDVRRTDELYTFLKPWVDGHPNMALRDGLLDVIGCPVCSSTHTQRRGVEYTQVCSYPRYQCRSCGKWFRGAKRFASSEGR